MVSKLGSNKRKNKSAYKAFLSEIDAIVKNPGPTTMVWFLRFKT